MAKQQWWVFQGAPANIKKAYKTVKTGGGTLVMDRVDTFYLRIQSSETAFVADIAKDYSVKPKAIAHPPAYGATPCGQLSTHPRVHSRSCRSCQQLKRNAAAAVGIEVPANGLDGLPITERRLIWDNAVAVAAAAEAEGSAEAERARTMETTPSGNASAVLGWGGRRAETPKTYNTRKAEEAKARASALFEQAVYWDGVAAMYAVLTEPTAGVVEAQKALDEAMSREQIERHEQREALRLMLEQGPPDSSKED